MDADDTWYPSKLEKQLEVLQKDSNIGLVFCNTYFRDEQGAILKEFKYKKEELKDIFQFILDGCRIITPSLVLIRKECFNTVGKYKESLWNSDWEVYVRIAKKYKIDFIDESLVNYTE